MIISVPDTKRDGFSGANTLNGRTQFLLATRDKSAIQSHWRQFMVGDICGPNVDNTYFE